MCMCMYFMDYPHELAVLGNDLRIKRGRMFDTLSKLLLCWS
jgi:hypothetical protein